MLKNKIKSEVLNYINEESSFNGNKMDFSQTIESKNIFFTNYNSFSKDYDSDILQKNIFVNWELRLNIKEYGIDGFSIDITKLNGGFTVQLYDKQTDELVNEIEKNINDIDWFFEVNADEYIFGERLYIKELEFDVNNKNCIVSF